MHRCPVCNRPAPEGELCNDSRCIDNELAAWLELVSTKPHIAGMLSDEALVAVIEMGRP